MWTRIALLCALSIILTPGLSASNTEDVREKPAEALETADARADSEEATIVSFSSSATAPMSDDRNTPGTESSCTSTAFCGPGLLPVTCTAYGHKATCKAGSSAVCPGFQGFAECNGVKTWCPPCPPCGPAQGICNEGDPCQSDCDCNDIYGEGRCELGECLCA